MTVVEIPLYQYVYFRTMNHTVLCTYIRMRSGDYLDDLATLWVYVADQIAVTHSIISPWDWAEFWRPMMSSKGYQTMIRTHVTWIKFPFTGIENIVQISTFSLIKLMFIFSVDIWLHNDILISILARFNMAWSHRGGGYETNFLRSVNFPIFHHCRNTGYLLNIMSIFDRCRRSSAVVTPVN